MIIKTIIISFLLISTTWTPVKKDETLGPIIFAQKCGENFLIGLDQNKNGIIDTCYELKWKGTQLYKKYTKIWFNIYDGTILKDQGCVCKNERA